MAALVTFIVGAALGYLGQRARLCFIGGIRDFILVRDTTLLRGFVALIMVAGVLYPVAGWAGGDVEGYPAFRARQEQTLEVASMKHSYGACYIPEETILIREEEGGVGVSRVAVVTVLAGFALGLFSTLANGCPFRQHVLAASGNQDAWAYLAGFYLAAVLFGMYVLPRLTFLLE